MSFDLKKKISVTLCKRQDTLMRTLTELSNTGRNMKLFIRGKRSIDLWLQLMGKRDLCGLTFVTVEEPQEKKCPGGEWKREIGSVMTTLVYTSSKDRMNWNMQSTNSAFNSAFLRKTMIFEILILNTHTDRLMGYVTNSEFYLKKENFFRVVFRHHLH